MAGLTAFPGNKGTVRPLPIFRKHSSLKFSVNLYLDLRRDSIFNSTWHKHISKYFHTSVLCLFLRRLRRWFDHRPWPIRPPDVWQQFDNLQKQRVYTPTSSTIMQSVHQIRTIPYGLHALCMSWTSFTIHVAASPCHHRGPDNHRRRRLALCCQHSCPRRAAAADSSGAWLRHSDGTRETATTTLGPTEQRFGGTSTREELRRGRMIQSHSDNTRQDAQQCGDEYDSSLVNVHQYAN